MGIGDNIIDDPLSRFMNEEDAREAGIKDPVTGIRTPVDKAQQKQLRNDEIKRKQEVKKRVLTQLLNDDLGREWLYDLLDYCGMFQSLYANTDRQTSYNNGARHIGEFIESGIKKSGIREYFLMLEEGWERGKMWDDMAGDKS